jgi:hypothetical protein
MKSNNQHPCATCPLAASCLYRNTSPTIKAFCCDKVRNAIREEQENRLKELNNPSYSNRMNKPEIEPYLLRQMPTLNHN